MEASLLLLEWLYVREDGRWIIMLTSLQYGNQAMLDYHYSHATLLVRIPSFKKRELLKASPQHDEVLEEGMEIDDKHPD